MRKVSETYNRLVEVIARLRRVFSPIACGMMIREFLRGDASPGSRSKRSRRRDQQSGTFVPSIVEFLEVRALMSAASVNLVLNSGFESGITKWNWNTSGGAAANYAVDTAISHSGGSSVRLSDGSRYGANVYGALAQNIGGLTVGNTYFISAWIKG